MISPSIGRIVLYHPKPQSGDPPPLLPDQPYAAVVTCVHDDRLINLAVMNHAGFGFARQSVVLAQDDDLVEQGMAEWMKFQKGQASKTDDVSVLLAARLAALEARLDEHHELLDAMTTPAAPPPVDMPVSDKPANEGDAENHSDGG